MILNCQRKYVIVVLLAIMVNHLMSSTKEHSSKFVRVRGNQFEVHGKRYCFLGTNLWYGCNLGALAEGGNRERLIRELDFLKSMGIKNLRVLGASEGITQHNTVYPPLQPEKEKYDEKMLEGLDFLLAEMKKREMFAVIFLNNYWVWSGGMAQYVSWFENNPVPNPFLRQYSWPEFMAFSAQFYAHQKANEAYRKYIKMLINRMNQYTGITYRDDPTIMSWQLANEPRPAPGNPGDEHFKIFIKWVEETANYIRSLDPNHLISTGNEGLMGCLGSKEMYLASHQLKNIDYMTVHLWILNWRWFDPFKPEETYPEAEERAVHYLNEHIQFADSLGKPLVLEEFGIPRDFHSYLPDSETTYRNRYFNTVFELIFRNAKMNGPFVGSNFWTWGGYGKVRDPEEAVWRRGDAFTGDPPQEPQGRNSVFITDTLTLQVLKKYASKMNDLNQ